MIVDKGTYARMRQRTPAALSHWIRDGKLTPPALVCRDGRELVDVAAADEQLAAVLDPSQQLARPHPIAAPAPRPEPRYALEQLLDARTGGELNVLIALQGWLPTLADHLALRMGVDKSEVEAVIAESHAGFLERWRQQ
ncbi:MAG: hypothetical protein AB7E79_09695 [Rhodospirillaceae bacterium]